MTHVNTAHRGARIAAVLAAVIIGVTACGSDSKSSSTAAPEPPAKVAPVGGDAGQVVAPAGTTPSSANSTGSGGTPVDTQTGGGLPLSDRHGGQIYERTINIADDRSSTASFVIKLPPKEVEAAIAELDAIGVRRTVSQGTEDVTSQVVDINARLDTAQASLDRVRKLLEAATDLGQVLSLESQLTERETLVEQYQAMKRAIDERVSLATLRIHLGLSPEPVAKTVVPAKHSSSLSISKSFKSGWHGFVIALAAILIFVGYTAPFLVMAAIAALVLIPITRRRLRAQRNRSAVPPPPPAPAADPRTSEPDSVGAARNP